MSVEELLDRIHDLEAALAKAERERDAAEAEKDRLGGLLFDSQRALRDSVDNHHKNVRECAEKGDHWRKVAREACLLLVWTVTSGCERHDWGVDYGDSVCTDCCKEAEALLQKHFPELLEEFGDGKEPGTVS